MLTKIKKQEVNKVNEVSVDELNQFVSDMLALGYTFHGDENNLYVGWYADQGYQPGVEDGMEPFQIPSEGVARFKNLPNWRLHVLAAAVASQQGYVKPHGYGPFLERVSGTGGLMLRA